MTRKPKHQVKFMSEAVLVREWGAEAFHHRVLEFETRGYIARRETYQHQGGNES